MSEGSTTLAGATQNVNGTQDFRLLLAQHDSSLPEAVHALYYLPENYKLVVRGAQTRDDIMAWAEQGIMNRIEFEQTEVLPKGAAPFLPAGAIIYAGSNPTQNAETTPTVVVSEGAADITSDKHHGFTVAAGNPEAFATAVLRIARAQA